MFFRILYFKLSILEHRVENESSGNTLGDQSLGQCREYSSFDIEFSH